MRVTGILLAAGSSRRFGGAKLLASWRGRPLFEHALEALASCPGIEETLVVTRPAALQVPAWERVREVENPAYAEGMGASLRTGIEAAPADADAYLVALADMPGTTPSLVASLLARWRACDRIVVPVHRGRRGHPVILPARFRPELLALRGDVGAREILRAHADEVEEVPVDDPAVLFDVDLPADLAWPGSDAVGTREKVLVKGAGEQASAVGHRLFRAGYRVVMTDIAQPTAIRRTVSFCTALQEGEITVEGVPARRHELDDVAAMPAAAWDHVVVCVDPEARLVQRWRPDVIVDGRILKHNLDNSPEDAGLVIGLGPGLEAGRHVHVVVETNRGHDLGRVITQGASAPDTGEPGNIGGFTHERLVRAPEDGLYATTRAIGETLAAGDVVCTVNGAPVKTGVAGVLRGLLWPGLAVTRGQKLADVDPRGDARMCRTLSDKARTISGSVLEVVVAHGGRQGGARA
jgi:xanthine dehydrogenase accessory factor